MDMLGLLAYATVTFMAVVGVLAILLPFFVLRIRNELISVNRNLERVIQVLESSPPAARSAAGESPLRFCRTCGTANRAGEAVCSACGTKLH